MMQQLRDQAERFGTRFITDLATRVEFAQEPGGLHRVWIDDEEHSARAVILAMGAEHRKLGVPGEEELSGRGVSYCATCDAAFFKDRTTLIVGGGDSAMEEAMFLAKFSSKVTVVHRRDDFRASRIMLDRARSHANIEFLTPYVVEELLPGESGALGLARLRNSDSGEQLELALSGAFVAIGHEPQSELVRGTSISTRTATSRSRDARPEPTDRASSPPATSSTTLSPGRHGSRLRLSGGARR